MTQRRGQPISPLQKTVLSVLLIICSAVALSYFHSFVPSSLTSLLQRIPTSNLEETIVPERCCCCSNSTHRPLIFLTIQKSTAKKSVVLTKVKTYSPKNPPKMRDPRVKLYEKGRLVIEIGSKRAYLIRQRSLTPR